MYYVTALAYARQPTEHGWRHGDVLEVVADYGNALSVRNRRTGETATLLDSQVDRVPAAAVLRSDMEANVAEFARGGLDLCNGEFVIVGRDLAALALFEAMSEFSEATSCAGWESGNGANCWSWLRTGRYVSLVSPPACLRPTLVGLANASRLWWADYLYAVPLAEWIAEHGTVDGIAADLGGTD